MAKKRSHGEGTLSRKENGRWEIQIMVGYKPDGKRDIRSFSGETQREAKAKRDEFLRKREVGLLTGKDLRFEEWADTWFENHKDNIKPTTQDGYRYTLRILKDHFGRRKLSEIKAMDIEQFLKKLRKDGRSDSALAQCRGMLFQNLTRLLPMISSSKILWLSRTRCANDRPERRKPSRRTKCVRCSGNFPRTKLVGASG